jgi:hypothetical protein
MPPWVWAAAGVGSQNFSEFDGPRRPKATGYVAFFYEHGDRRISER